MIKHIDSLLNVVDVKIERCKEQNKQVSNTNPFWLDLENFVDDQIKDQIRSFSKSVDRINFSVHYNAHELKVRGYELKNELAKLITASMILYDRIEEKHQQENKHYFNVYPTEHPLHPNNKKED